MNGKILITISGLCLYSVLLQAQQDNKRFSFTRQKMGSPFSLTFYCKDSTQAALIADGAFAYADSLINILSDYIDSSELNRLCVRAGSAMQPFHCSPVLFDVLWQSKKAFAASKGFFDITMGPVTRLWRGARREKIFAADSLVKKRLSLTGFNKVQLNNKAHTTVLKQHGMQLDLGGIGQGYIAQRTAEYIRAAKINNALIDVSGDIVCLGHPPGKKGWIVAINAPESEHELLPHQLVLSDMAVTTSGDVYQYIEHNGQRYSHIINPKTGYGITSLKNVTVIAKDGTTADWLTKACSLMPVKSALALATQLNANVLIVELKKGKLIYHSSENFRKYYISPTPK